MNPENYVGKASLADPTRILEMWRNGVCHYFAVSILPEFPPNVWHTLRNGFASQKKLSLYCAANGVALYRCASSIKIAHK